MYFALILYSKMIVSNFMKKLFFIDFIKFKLHLKLTSNAISLK